MPTPISVEDMLAKQKAEKEAASKPKFLSKAERAALALEKRNAEVKAQQEREEAEKSDRIAFEKAAEEERRRQEAARYGSGSDRYDRYGNRDGRYGGRDDRHGGQNGYGRDARDGRQNGRGADYGHQNGSHRHGPPMNGGPPSGPRGNGPPAGPRSMHNGHQAHTSSPLASSSNGITSSPKPNVPGEAALPTDAELDSIRARYLGQKVVEKKPRLRKEGGNNNKNVNFDWKAEDDTSRTESAWAMEARGQAQSVLMTGRQAQPMTAEQEKYADPLERRKAGKGTADERHWSEKPLDAMSDRDWRIFREDFSISARGGSIPLPLRSWRESAIPENILDVVDEIGYKEPSPIQRQAIPIGLTNRDLIGIAQTGSGKTAAFVIPMLNYISRLPPLSDENRHLGPQALIIAPTRELAQQIQTETIKFTSRLGLTTVGIVGGREVEGQMWELRNGAEVIVATPGRLRDMLQGSKIVLTQCRYVVLDEADRLLHLGFEQELNEILDSMPASSFKPENHDVANSKELQGYRVTTLFSATFPADVQRLAMKYLRKPATITIGNVGEGVDTVEQRVEFVQSEDKKTKRLQEILRSGEFAPPIIVFVGQKKTADTVVKYVHQGGMSAVSLHSDKSQAQREESLQALRDGEVSVLVATDVAGRGIDVPDVSLVINWQMPSSIEPYIHRIGRTGRAGKTGVAISFLAESDSEIFYDLKQEIARSPISTMNPELARHEAAKTRMTAAMKRKADELGE
ncbi:P-loop containing nucleoside triphosphate hydrolase protein [Kockovaella imperatae]|uniref:RNA helicase n=1 Tax=Kockovaella imperatae TaxID=4999 RepID=A0A1Y1UTX3_9TREE|nr:P-loop containing nucleoside triphosphate hydrolase protein [Kockovaella imperatae]ORX40984.1 P-loop containing nucleoside triphosphate hydrolase protein [Kockovaella imperatae]